MQISYRYLCSVYYVVFTIKAYTKAAVAFIGILAIFDQFCSNVAWRYLIGTCAWFISWSLSSKVKQRPQQPLKVSRPCRDAAFDGKDHEINQVQVPISYLHAKFEQNWSINDKYMFKGRCGHCLAFLVKAMKEN